MHRIKLITRIKDVINDFLEKWSIKLFIGIPTIFLFLIIIGPIIYLLYQSTFSYWLYKPFARTFIGLKNYEKIFSDPLIRASIIRSFYLVFFTLLPQMPIAMAIAVSFSKKFPGRNIVRALFLLPFMFTPIVTGITWRMLYNPNLGMINYFLSIFGISGPAWLGSAKLAMPAIILTDLWMTTPFVTIIFLAGLISFPDELKDAASIDGASSWQTFRWITIPWLKPLIGIAVLFRMVDVFKRFDTILTMTGGGPGNVTTTFNIQAYNEAFQFFNIGTVSAMSVFFVVLIIVICIFLIRFINRE
jgi:multiple sugar transport system permease protein